MPKVALLTVTRFAVNTSLLLKLALLLTFSVSVPTRPERVRLALAVVLPS